MADGLLRELERFFAEHAESVPYFAPEAAEHLEVMTRSLLALEQRTEPAEDEVASLFRAVHTLKGAAYTVGCAPVGDVAHRIEDLLEGVRDGRLALSPAVIEAVFGGVDALRLLLGSASVISPSVRSVVQRTLDTLDALRPAPAPLEAEPVLGTGPGQSRRQSRLRPSPRRSLTSRPRSRARASCRRRPRSQRREPVTGAGASPRRGGPASASTSTDSIRS